MKVHCAIPEIKGGACPVADQKKLANFFPCAENAAGGHSSFSDALPCAKKWGLNVAAIQKCYVSVRGVRGKVVLFAILLSGREGAHGIVTHERASSSVHD